MIFFYIIITALPTTALTKGVFECKVSEHSGPQQCTGALGEPLRFYLPTNIKTVKKNNNKILTVIKTKMVAINTEYSNWSGSFTNGTFQLNTATKLDSGDYQLETYNSDVSAFLSDNTEDEVVYSDVRLKPTKKTRPSTHQNAT
ncbi:hypothetical protein Q5P01_019139 [Channa striata]|uniref:Uncharacterized protein n=1 Tax=Channa striata TaxID=64152 RepID=A0AA88M0H9_CHASR|nr:hypothetical protein Q5P01_019139 [Channa striata]